MLTQKRLKEVLHYDEKSGVFTWKFRKIKKSAGSHQNKGYIQIMIDSKNYLAHRLAWMYVYGSWPINQIDHINRDKKDNKICNLRDVTNSQNQLNNGVRKHNSSGINNVVKSSKSHKPWAAQLHRNNKKIFLGYFDTVEQASLCVEKYKSTNP